MSELYGVDDELPTEIGDEVLDDDIPETDDTEEKAE